jgi:predicted ArsR family transcriptional regulator
VLAYLGQRGSASAAQVGHALNMSAATVRHHLSILVGDGRVVTSGTVLSRRAGRPQKVFRLSERVQGENLGMLADILLTAWFQELPVEKRQVVALALARELERHIGNLDASLPLPKRLSALTENLSDLHYQASWEAGALGPRILFGHCPYTAIIAQHPELCTVDAALLSAAMNADADQLAKISGSVQGATHCVFAMRAIEARPSH